MARIQPFSERITVIGSRLDQAASARSSAMPSGASSKLGAPAAELGLLAEALFQRLDLVGDLLPLLVVGREQRLQLLALLGERHCARA